MRSWPATAVTPDGAEGGFVAGLMVAPLPNSPLVVNGLDSTNRHALPSPTALTPEEVHDLRPTRPNDVDEAQVRGDDFRDEDARPRRQLVAVGRRRTARRNVRVVADVDGAGVARIGGDLHAVTDGLRGPQCW